MGVSQIELLVRLLRMNDVRILWRVRTSKRFRAGLLRSSRVRAHESDPHHVGRARCSKRNAGDDDDALPGLGKPFLHNDAAGALDHVILVARVLGNDAMHAQTTASRRPVDILGESATVGGLGRSRATRSAVEPDEVQHTMAARSTVSAI